MRTPSCTTLAEVYLLFPDDLNVIASNRNRIDGGNDLGLAR